jgi:hypothetical protein
VWVWGDGQGEVLNLQVRSPEHLVSGIGEHYVVVDFQGWRYYELVEPEGERYTQYVWPYGDAYSIYRESVQYQQVDTVGVWYNHLPPGRSASCCLGPVRALPLVDVVIRGPSLAIGDRRLVFPVELETGSYLEYEGSGTARVYGRQGELLGEVKPEGQELALKTGANQVEFACQAQEQVRPRIRVTLSSRGEGFSAV